MSALSKIILFLGLALSTPAAAWEQENGGTIIFAVDYKLVLGEERCPTLVLVTSADEIAHIMESLETRSHVVFRVDGDKLAMHLKPYGTGRLVGRLSDSGQRVLVVSREFVEKYGL